MPDDKNSLRIHKLRQTSTRHSSFIDWWEQAKIDLLTSNDSNYSLRSFVRSFVQSSSFIFNAPRFTVKFTFILTGSSRFHIVKRNSPTLRETFKSLKLKDKAERHDLRNSLRNISLSRWSRNFWPRVSTISRNFFASYFLRFPPLYPFKFALFKLRDRRRSEPLFYGFSPGSPSSRASDSTNVDCLLELYSTILSQVDKLPINLSPVNIK